MADDSLGMFGSPVGEYRADQQAQLQADTQLKLGQVAMQPAQQREHEAKAGIAELSLANQQRMAEQLQQRLIRQAQGTAAQTTDTAGQLEEIAEMSLNAGLITQGSNTAKAAGYLRGRAAQVEHWQALQQKTALETKAKQIGLLGSLVNNVTDQASWDRAMAIYQFNTGEPSPYAGIPYSPELAGQIRDGAISAGKQIELKLREEENASKERNRSSAEKLRDVRIRTEDERARIAREREDRLAKNGGGRVPTTPTEDIRQATRLITKDFPKLEGTLEAASSIASEAQLLLRRNPALDRGQAIQQAFNTAKLRGDFHEFEEAGMFGTGFGADVGGSKKQKYTPGGHTPETALALPKSDREAAVGKHYKLANGTIVQKLPNGKFGVVKGAVAAPIRTATPLAPDTSDNAAPDDDDDGED